MPRAPSALGITDDELTAARKLHRGATPSNPDRVVVLCDDERIPQICGSEEAVEPPGDNVVRLAIHRTAIVRHKSAEGDPKAEKHRAPFTRRGAGQCFA